jgi:hypothetical protein
MADEQRFITAYTKAGVDHAISAAIAALPPEPDLTGYETREHAEGAYQPRGDYATNADVVAKVAEAKADGQVDLSGYAKKGELDGYAKKTDIPDVSGFAEKSSLSAYALASAIPDMSEYETASHAASTYQPKGDYATTAAVDAKVAAAQLAGSGVDLSPYATKDDLAVKADVSAIPDVSGLATKAEVASGLATKADATALSGFQAKGDYALKSDIPAAPDLTPYAKKADVTSSIASATSGLATKATVNGLDSRVTALEGKTSDGGANVLVLGATEGVPAGTPAGTIVLRKAV